MNIQEYNVLMSIFNGLSEVKTCGVDTIAMGKSLSLFNAFLIEKQAELLQQTQSDNKED